MNVKEVVVIVPSIEQAGYTGVEARVLHKIWYMGSRAWLSKSSQVEQAALQSLIKKGVLVELNGQAGFAIPPNPDLTTPVASDATDADIRETQVKVIHEAMNNLPASRPPKYGNTKHNILRQWIARHTPIIDHCPDRKDCDALLASLDAVTDTSTDHVAPDTYDLRRERIAAQMLAALLVDRRGPTTATDLADEALEYADALLDAISDANWIDDGV